jgi:hypothetical protein
MSTESVADDAANRTSIPLHVTVRWYPVVPRRYPDFGRFDGEPRPLGKAYRTTSSRLTTVVEARIKVHHGSCGELRGRSDAIVVRSPGGINVSLRCRPEVATPAVLPRQRPDLPRARESANTGRDIADGGASTRFPARYPEASPEVHRNADLRTPTACRGDLCHGKRATNG